MANTFGEKLTAATPIATLGVALALHFTGYDMWWGALILGWVVLTPLVAILAGDWGGHAHANDDVGAAIERRIAREIDPEDGTATSGGDPRWRREDALDVLRTRYADGDLDEETFERKVERLLETESIEDAETLFETGSTDATATLERDDDAGADVERESERT